MHRVGLELKENQYSKFKPKYVVCLKLKKVNAEKKSQHQELHINNNVFKH